LPGEETRPERPSRPADALAVKEDHPRWLEGFLRSENRALSARVEELEGQLRRRTIMLVGAVTFATLSAAVGVGIAVLRLPEPPWASLSGRGSLSLARAPAGPQLPARAPDGTRDAEPAQAEGAATSPFASPAPPREVTGSAVTGAREPAAAVPAGSSEVGLDPPGIPKPASGERDSGPAGSSANPWTADGGRTPDATPAASEDVGVDAADPAAPVPVDPGSVGSIPEAPIAVAEEPVASDGSAPLGTASPSAAEGPAAVPPPWTVEEVAPAGSFALYFFSVRPLARVASEWRRLMERHPELAGLEPRPPRPVDVPGKGTMYPVEAGAFATRAEAQAICDRLRSRDQPCRVLAP
jgi:hypothetical protein